MNPLIQIAKVASLLETKGLTDLSDRLDRIALLLEGRRCNPRTEIPFAGKCRNWRALLKDPNVSVRDRRGSSMLHYLAKYGPQRVKKAVLRHPQVGHAKDINGKAPLHYLAMRGSPEVKLLVMRHPDAIIRMDNQQNTALHYVAMDPDPRIQRAIMRHPHANDPRLMNSKGYLPLDYVKVMP